MKSILEIWKWVPGYEGQYKVSNTGLVKSVDTVVHTYNGGEFIRKGKLLRPAKDKSGYLRVGLGKKTKSYKVHRMVAQAFIPNPDNLPQVNHKDENKTNNWVTNLEWCTAKYNINYGTSLKRMSDKLRNGCLAKPVYQYSLDLKFIAKYPSVQEVSRILGINTSHISEVCNGKLNKTQGFIWSYTPLPCHNTQL